MGLRIQSKRYISAGLPVLAAALMSGAAAHAASNSLVPCDQVGRDLKSLEVPADALPVRLADHIPIDTGNPDSLDDQGADNVSATPVLDLTPRVTSILRDVFDTTNEELTQETRSLPSFSPLADSVEESAEIEPADTEIEESDLPRFQKRMFRKDI